MAGTSGASTRDGTPELARTEGFVAVASDGPLGEVELTLVPPEREAPDYLVVRTGRFPRVRHPVIPAELVVRVETASRRVYLRGRSGDLARLSEELPLAV